MRPRPSLILLASLAATSFAAVPALATDTPGPAELAPAPPVSSLSTVLGKCTDKTKPAATVTATGARNAAKTRTLRGKATDTGCGVAMVTVSIERLRGKKCQVLNAKGKLSAPGSCKDHWLMATGTKQWRVSLKGFPKGTYRIRTRAIDFAGNIQTPAARRLTLR